MTSDNQKSVNQLVHEAVGLVAAATKSAAYAHADAVTVLTLARAADPSGRTSILLHAQRTKLEALDALGGINCVQDALHHLEQRLAQTVLGPKQSDDGWIEWAGGDCPVAEDAVVDLRFRNGEELDTGQPRMWRWTDEDHYSDIVAYRIHKPATLAEATAEIERLRAELETQKCEHESLREWSADQADQILELIDAHNDAAAQYNEAQAEYEALKREVTRTRDTTSVVARAAETARVVQQEAIDRAAATERKLSELQAAHEALQQAHQDAVQQLASRNNELANLRKFIS